ERGASGEEAAGDTKGDHVTDQGGYSMLGRQRRRIFRRTGKSHGGARGRAVRVQVRHEKGLRRARREREESVLRGGRTSRESQGMGEKA
ncbi:unnamed protein product, partial [Ectocarpus sp. 13 AM-2016]